MDRYIKNLSKALSERGHHGSYQFWDKLWRLSVVGDEDTLVIDIRQRPETYEVTGYSANTVNMANWDTGKGLSDANFFSFEETDKEELCDRLLKEIISLTEEEE